MCDTCIGVGERGILGRSTIYSSGLGGMIFLSFFNFFLVPCVCVCRFGPKAGEVSLASGLETFLVLERRAGCCTYVRATAVRRHSPVSHHCHCCSGCGAGRGAGRGEEGPQ